MIFKNNRGEIGWYVIGIILALIVLLISLIAIFDIGSNSGAANNLAKNTCVTVFHGTCAAPGIPPAPRCAGGTQEIPNAPCTDTTQICCTAS